MMSESKTVTENVELKVNLGKTKQVRSALKQVVTEDGELVLNEYEKHFQTVVKTDNFFMCFFENFAPIYGLKLASDIKVIACLCQLAEFNTGIVQLSTKIRKEISKITGVALTNLSRNLKRLKEADLITEEDGEVTINPAVFWKGSIQERVELIRSGELEFRIRLVEKVDNK